MSTLAPSPAPVPSTALGHKVRAKIKPIDLASVSARKQAIAGTIADALMQTKRT